jgi:hypothetical protein
MRDDLLLDTSKGWQAEDGVKDGQSGGSDVPPQVEVESRVRWFGVQLNLIES